MIGIADNDHRTLTLLGTLALLGLGAHAWLQRRAPIRVEEGLAPPYAQWEAQLQGSRQVNVNQATAVELERLPEIGPTLAQRIVDYRQAHGPFAAPEALDQVAGIGQKTLEALEPYVTVDE